MRREPVFLYAIVVLLSIMLSASLTRAATQTINTIPANNASMLTDLQRFLREEDAARYGEQFGSFIVSGGTHGTSTSLTSTISAVVAYPGGFRVSAPATARTYTASRRTFVYIYSHDGAVAGDFTRSGGTGCSIPANGIVSITNGGSFVFVQCATTSATPTVTVAAQRGIAILMAVDTSATAITAAVDLRNGSAVLPAFNRADFPAAGLSGRLLRRLDGVRGVWMDQGFQWVRVGGATVSANEFGGIADGDSHPLSQRYATLAAAQMVYPHATSLTNEIDWAAIQGAINAAQLEQGTSQNNAIVATQVLIEAGTWVVNKKIEITKTGLVVEGQGNDLTFIRILSSFDMTELGVIQFNSGEPGPILRHLSISFAQPDTAVRTAMTQYPPAIYAQAQPRFRVEHVKISRAWNGIDMRGNSGGANIIDLQMSGFNMGIQIDGSQDTVRIDNYHYWPFGVTVTQEEAFYDPANWAIQSGRMDDLKLRDCLFISGGGARFWQGATGATSASLSNCQFDTMATLKVEAGAIKATTTNFTLGRTGRKLIDLTGGSLTIASSQFIMSVVPDAGGFIQVSTVSPGLLNITGSLFDLDVIDATVINISGSGKRLILTGNEFRHTVNLVYANPMIRVVGAGVRAQIVSNIVSDTGTGSGTFVTIDADDHHVLSLNRYTGWGVSLPTGVDNDSLMAINLESGVAGDGILGTTGLVIGHMRVKRSTGNADAAGIVLFAHGISAAHQRVLFASGFYKGPSGEMLPLTFSSIDGINARFTGATNGAAFRVTFIFVKNVHVW